ncbi:hypothetical protein KBY97_00925 [Synechococcus sp. ATX 2A4]|nr:hypothetical protein [Synechococcus sp. ATX 2A4]
MTAGPPGLFFGVTANGGTDGFGTVFSFDGSSITSLASFGGTDGGVRPRAELTAGGGGLFYGTTSAGGANSAGAIFSFNSNTNTISTLASFDGSNGANPTAALTAGSGGIFYGTTEEGGTHNGGTVFSFDSNNDTIASLASFVGANGSTPSAALIEGTGGLFYGTTERGGTHNSGTVFSFDSNSNTIASIVSFVGANGESPSAALTPGSAGLFYGTTRRGGSDNEGTVFSFDSNSNTITSLVSFNSDNGESPSAALTPGSGGLFYGTTDQGGANDFGSIFSFDSNSNTITSLVSFDGANGESTEAALTAGPADIFYGTTNLGGANNEGTLYTLQVPGPLPIFGAGMAFGWSRKLRRRIKASRFG